MFIKTIGLMCVRLLRSRTFLLGICYKRLMRVLLGNIFAENEIKIVDLQFNRGCLLHSCKMAEIIPLQPDADNADVGR